MVRATTPVGGDALPTNHSAGSWLTALIHDGVLGLSGAGVLSSFLHGAWGQEAAAWNGSSLVVKPGSEVTASFSVDQGHKLDLTQVLSGAPLASDLTNIGDFVKVLGHDGQSSAGGVTTSLEITGPNGSAVVNLAGSGKLDVNDLLSHHSLILPPH